MLAQIKSALLITLLSFISTFVYAEDYSKPQVFIQSVNVVTGQIKEGSPFKEFQYEYYVTGPNDVAGTSIQLDKGDWRIGRVKMQKQCHPHTETFKAVHYFFYYPGYTELLSALGHKAIYRYTKNQLIEAVEQYLPSSNDYTLYRQERLFWDSSSRLVSRVLEDGRGQAEVCYHFQYNDKGQLVKETLFGNLSGLCMAPLIIQANGTPKNNGIESYSNFYDFADDLLTRELSDNGSLTLYNYHAKTKQCLSKMRRDPQRILCRHFYSYDSLGLLSRVIVDDGMGKSENDLTGVNARKILSIQSCLQEKAFGQPLVTENTYWDFATQKEAPLQKEVSTYSDKGELIQKDFYEASGNLHYFLKMNYNEQGELISTIDSRGNITESLEDKTRSIYDDFGHRIAFIDEYGNETTYQYDEFGRLIKTTYPIVLDSHDNLIQYELSQTYDIRNRLISSQDANGNHTKTVYNARGKPIKITYADGSYEAFIYFLDGQLKEYQGKDDHKIVYKRDAFGRVLQSEEYAPNRERIASLTYTYKGAYLNSLTDGKSFTTTFFYDGAGRQIGARHATKDGTKRREWTYDACGNRSTSSEWFGSHEEDYITKIEEKDINGRTMAAHLQEASGRIQRKINFPQNPTKEALFTQDIHIKNNRHQYVRQQDTVDINGVHEIQTYDAMERLETLLMLDCFGSKITEKHFRYDGNGNKTLERNVVLLQGETKRTYTIAWLYDSMNRLIDIVEGLESSFPKHVHYVYNQKGQLEAVVKPDGKQLIYQYDPAGRPILFTSSDDSFCYQYSYDTLHRLTTVKDLIHACSITRSYNDFNELTEETIGVHFTLKNSYDLAGRRLSVTLPDQSSIRYLYEGALLSSVQRVEKQGEVVYQHGYQYDLEPGRLIQSHLIGDCGPISYTYDARGCPSTIQSEWWSETIPEEGLDCYPHLTQMVVEDPAGKTSYSFSYTADHQLSGEEGTTTQAHTEMTSKIENLTRRNRPEFEPGTAGAKAAQLEQVERCKEVLKSEASRRRQKPIFEVASVYRHDSLYNRVSQNQATWILNDLNQVLNTETAEYRYDLNGNMIEKKEGNIQWTFEYDALNRLIRIAKNQELACAYIYDAFHRRLAQTYYEWDAQKHIWKPIETENFLYDGEKEIGKSDGQGNLVELRILGLGKGSEIGAAIALELQGRIYAPIHDHNGSVRCLIDTQTKQVAEFYRYTAFGLEEIFAENHQRIPASAIGNPWRFSSKRCDPFSALQFFGRRCYDPTLGRWTTPDPLFFYDASNLYTFVRNDPLTHCDPSGMFSMSSIWNTMTNKFWNCWIYIKRSSDRFYKDLATELHLPKEMTFAFERVGKNIFGELIFLGCQYEEAEINVYGQHELNNQVRVTFINGILTTQDTIIDNLELISQSHGGVNVHYIFRPTEGWTRDICQGILIKTAYYLGFYSTYTYLLAEIWKTLIQEMGGVQGGGVIVHYAHSLGGTETDRARALLTPEEQKMIRVITLGSATLARKEGFASVVNYVSRSDGVSSFILEPFGHIRNCLDPNTNVIFRGNFFQWPCFPCDHLLNGKTYQPIIIQLGEEFLIEFAGL